MSEEWGRVIETLVGYLVALGVVIGGYWLTWVLIKRKYEHERQYITEVYNEIERQHEAFDKERADIKAQIKQGVRRTNRRIK